jgi:hypothetical protein
MFLNNLLCLHFSLFYWLGQLHIQRNTDLKYIYQPLKYCIIISVLHIKFCIVYLFFFLKKHHFFLNKLFSFAAAPFKLFTFISRSWRIILWIFFYACNFFVNLSYSLFISIYDSTVLGLFKSLTSVISLAVYIIDGSSFFISYIISGYYFLFSG